MMAELIGKQLGHYQILEEVGRGGMASVYRARDSRDSQEVALKVLSPYVGQEPKFRARFEQEIQVLRHLRHPNIVPIFDFGESGGYAFIVMPFMAAGTLQQRMIGSPLSLAVTAGILHQLTLALDYAHSRDVVHRDLKPSNILIAEDGKVMLSDFGFARLIDTSISLTGSALIGTPAYMSPEQCRGEEATPLSDQYSLGVILYQMVTGRLPYEAETAMGVVIMHATEPLPPPRLFCPDLPGRVEGVLLKALEKNPKDRYPSVLALAQAFQVAVHGRKRKRGSDTALTTPVLDHPTMIFRGISYRLAKLRSSLRLQRRSSLYSVLLLLIATAAMLWGFYGWSENNGNAGALESTALPLVEMSDDRSAELLMTIEALSTAVAPMPGTAFAPGQIETSVAGTLAVLMATSEREAGLANAANQTASPTGTIAASPTNSPSGGTPNPTSASNPTPEPTALLESASPPSPSSTTPPSMTPSSTPSATPSMTPSITHTPTPSATETPKPTIDPAMCKHPSHPIFGCTPTPTL